MATAFKAFKLKGFTYSLVSILIAVYMYVNAQDFFPVDTAHWEKVILTYLVVTAFVFARKDLRDNFGSQSFFKDLPRLLLIFIVTLVGLSVTLGWFFRPEYFGIPSSLKTIGVSVLLVHGFIVATNEELIFRGWLDNTIGYVFGAIIFGFFHRFAVGSNWVGMFVLMGVGLLLHGVHIWLRKNSGDHIPNIAVHWAYNVFVMGMFIIGG